LTEYDDPDQTNDPQNNKTISKYIESVTDAEFSIRFKVSDSYKFDCDFLAFTIVIDGQTVIRSWLSDMQQLVEVKGVKQPHTDAKYANLHKFKFTNITTGKCVCVEVEKSADICSGIGK
jgi:hypothetical protein